MIISKPEDFNLKSRGVSFMPKQLAEVLDRDPASSARPCNKGSCIFPHCQMMSTRKFIAT
jgi:hypothetical protein